MAGPEEGTLELARSGLKVESGLLVRHTSDGKVVGRHDLRHIDDVALRGAWDGMGLSFLALGLALAVLSHFALPSGVGAWVAMIGGVVLAFFGIVGSRKRLLVITSAHGVIRYKIDDPAEDASGFVATLRALVEEARRSRGSVWGAP